jgi:signal transduction histidine kinase
MRLNFHSFIVQLADLKKYRYSLTYTLLKHYLLAGVILFLSVAAVYIYSSTSSFASIATNEASKELAFHIYDELTLTEQGNLVVELGEVSQWSYDALYSNIGFRVVSQKTLKTLLKSAPQVEEFKTLLHYVPLDIPRGSISLASNLGEIIGFRYAKVLDGQPIYIDVVRSDRLGKFAEQAVVPAMINSMLLAAGTSLSLFVIVCFFSINSITKKIGRVSIQANQIKPEQMGKRLQVDNVPNEIQPLTKAMNRALDRVELGFSQQKRFVANAAHELRTPLTILQGRVELNEIPEEVRQTLLTDITYMSRLVEQLLDLSRAQNKHSYATQPVKVANVMSQACQLLGPVVLNLNKDLELIVNDKNFILYGDQASLTVACKNLIENALKYSPEQGKVMVVVNHNSITVSDNGSGFNDEDKVMATQAFWRKDQADNKGSGLGLAIVDEITRTHQGRLHIDTCPKLLGALMTLDFAEVQGS